MNDEVRIGEGPKELGEEALDQVTGADKAAPAPPSPSGTTHGDFQITKLIDTASPKLSG